MKDAPNTWSVYSLGRYLVAGNSTEVRPGVWLPARPLARGGFRRRLRAAWLAFTGRADVVVWRPEDGTTSLSWPAVGVRELEVREAPVAFPSDELAPDWRAQVDRTMGYVRAAAALLCRELESLPWSTVRARLESIEISTANLEARITGRRPS